MRSELGDETTLLGEREEVAGWQEAAVGMLPPGHDLVTDEASGGEIDDRLVVRHDLVVLERVTQLLHADSVRIVEARFSGLNASTRSRSVLLRPVHRRVRVADQVLRADAGGLGDGDADARVEVDLFVAEQHRRREGHAHPVTDLHRDGGAGVAQQHRELVAAETGDEVAVADRLRQATAGGASNASPIACPRLSLTTLNRSRSRNSTATGVRQASADSSCSMKCDRLASPVTGSCVVLQLSCSVAASWLVTSCTWVISNGSGPASVIRAIEVVPQRSAPSPRW